MDWVNLLYHELIFLLFCTIFCCNVIFSFHAFWLDSNAFCVWQILPEKYSYYRRFDQSGNRSTDCVICMTVIDLSERSNDCMVKFVFDQLTFRIFVFVFMNRHSKNDNCFAGDTLWPFLPLRVFTKVDGYKDGMPNLSTFFATRLIMPFQLLVVELYQGFCHRKSGKYDSCAKIKFI